MRRIPPRSIIRRIFFLTISTSGNGREPGRQNPTQNQRWQIDERMKEEPRLEWGHRVFDPDGQPVQLPAKAIIRLRHLGVLIRNRDLGGLQISPAIHEFLKPEYDAITVELRSVLGTNLCGPKSLVCHCRRCKRNLTEAIQMLKEGLLDFEAFLSRHRDAD